MFTANNGLAYQQRSNGNNGGNGSNNCNHNGGNQQSVSGKTRKPNPASGKTCHYCKKKNHLQSDCYKRKPDDARLVKVQEME